MPADATKRRPAARPTAATATQQAAARSTKKKRTAARRPTPAADGTYDSATAGRITGKRLLPFENKLVCVKNSTVHGLGLFSATRIKKGALVGVVEGRRTKRNNDHVVWIEEEDGEVWGLEPLNEFRFTNDSDAPNVVFFGEEVYALRSIPAGEEIFFDYDGEVVPAD